jgi:hypothetical protein
VHVQDDVKVVLLCPAHGLLKPIHPAGLIEQSI